MTNPSLANQTAARTPRIVLDGLFFQIAPTGIARLWKSYLEQWAVTDFAAHLIVLDRNHSAPRFPGIRYHDVPAYDWNASGKETLQIERWCQALQADVYISTFYSSPVQTRSVMMVHDMIMELLGNDDKSGLGQVEKTFAILHASHLVAVSHNTAKDLRTFFPYLTGNDVSVVQNGVDPIFRPASESRVQEAKGKYGLKKPYFLLVGTRGGFCGYKNAVFLVRTLDRMKGRTDFEVACVGGEPALGELGAFPHVAPRLLHHVSEEDLIALYSGAQALVYPSLYEGFGLPIIEAMACGCPVITCPNGSIPEVAGDAALFVKNDNSAELEAALLKVGDPLVRAELKAKGEEQARLFSWKKAADQLAQILLRAAASPPKPARETRLWQEMREQEQRLAPILANERKGRRRATLKLGKYRLEIKTYRDRP